MMKYILLLCLCGAAFCLSGCNGDAPVPPQESSVPPQEALQEYSPHSAMNAINYEGRYLLEGSASGTEAEAVELRYSGTFSLAQADGVDIGGRYRWDVTGTVITLDFPDGREQSFWMGEGMMKQVSPASAAERIFKKQ